MRRMSCPQQKLDVFTSLRFLHTYLITGHEILFRIMSISLRLSRGNENVSITETGLLYSSVCQTVLRRTQGCRERWFFVPRINFSNSRGTESGSHPRAFQSTVLIFYFRQNEKWQLAILWRINWEGYVRIRRGLLKYYSRIYPERLRETTIELSE